MDLRLRYVLLCDVSVLNLGRRWAVRSSDPCADLRQALQTFALNDLQIDMRSYVILVSAAKILPVLLLI